MSGSSTEAANFTPATMDQLTSGAALLLAVQPAAGETPSLGMTATAAQLAALIVTGTIVEDEVTFNATPISVPNLPTIPLAGGYCFVQGTIVAQDQTTRDMAVWNIALAVSRVNNGTVCTAIGDTTPSNFVQSGTTVNCNVALGANSNGPSIILIGLSAENVSWGINLNATAGD